MYNSRVVHSFSTKGRLCQLIGKKTELHLAHETSYLRKYALLAAILWCLTLSLSLFVNYRQHDRHLTDIGITVARSSFEKDILYRRWNASFGGLYVGGIRPDNSKNPFLKKPGSGHRAAFRQNA